MDVLAWQNAAYGLAGPWHAGGRRAVGQARLPSARRDRERPASPAEAQRFLRVSLHPPSRHPPREAHTARSVGVLPLLRPLSRFLPPARAPRLDRRGRTCRGCPRGARGGVRKAVLPEAAVAVEGANRAFHCWPNTS